MLELAYLGLQIADPTTLNAFFREVIGLHVAA